MVVRLGTLYNLSNPENPIPLSGYHVDSLIRLIGADSYLITPSTPTHEFAGVPTFRYKFNNKAQADTFIPAGK